MTPTNDFCLECSYIDTTFLHSLLQSSCVAPSVPLTYGLGIASKKVCLLCRIKRIQGWAAGRKDVAGDSVARIQVQRSSDCQWFTDTYHTTVLQHPSGMSLVKIRKLTSAFMLLHYCYCIIRDLVSLQYKKLGRIIYTTSFTSLFHCSSVVNSRLRSDS